MIQPDLCVDGDCPQLPGPCPAKRVLMLADHDAERPLLQMQGLLQPTSGGKLLPPQTMTPVDFSSGVP
jgi:hypothetical protein